MKTLKVGICGWGNVATGLYKAINNNADAIEFNSGASLSIEAVSYTHLTLPTRLSV